MMLKFPLMQRPCRSYSQGSKLFYSTSSVNVLLRSNCNVFISIWLIITFKAWTISRKGNMVVRAFVFLKQSLAQKVSLSNNTNSSTNYGFIEKIKFAYRILWIFKFLEFRFLDLRFTIYLKINLRENVRIAARDQATALCAS